MMITRIVLCCIALSLVYMCLANDVKITVNGVTSIAKTDDSFICATLDWWPRNKCDYNQCPWGNAGLLNLDLNDKILLNSVKAFSSLRIRVGGSLEDQLVYQVGKTIKKCPHFKLKPSGLFGYSKGCLTTTRWDQLNEFFRETGAKVTFGLNALIGRRKAANDSTLWVGSWDSQNARNLMKYTISKGYKIDSYEFGNELCGNGVYARVEAEQYGRDMIVLKKLVQELYPNPSTKPKVLGPAGFYDQKWFDTYLRVSGPNVVDGVTHHVYNLGSGDDPTLINKVQDPYFLDKVAQVYRDVARSVKQFGAWSGAWVGESGGAFNSGSKDISHSFANGFWYLDQLGMASTFNHKVFCRQTLVGGNYGLLNTTTFTPNPDYYAALLWHRLMGNNVLATSHQGSPYLRSYSHCSKEKVVQLEPGITLLLINLSYYSAFNVRVLAKNTNLYPGKSRDGSSSGAEQREEYHLTPLGGNIRSDVVLLNGTPLMLTNSSDIPAMNPRLVNPSLPITVSPQSIVFVTIRDFYAPACA